MMSENYLKLYDGTRLFYKEFPPGKSSTNDITLIYLHGGPGLDHTIHQHFWSKYFLEYRVILPDLRGHGRSDYCDKSKWNLKQWAKDVYDFCNILEIKNPIVAGTSFGGHVALKYGIDYPEQLGGLILTDTEAHQVFDEMLAAYEKAGGLKARKTAKEAFTKITKESLTKYQEICSPLFQNNPVIKDSFFDSILHLEITQYYNVNEHFKFNFLPELKKIKCKMLVITGDVSPLHRKENADKLATGLPSKLVEYKYFKGAGTPVFNHYPDEVSSCIKAFINLV